MALVSALPTTLGRAPQPGSITAQVDPSAALAWSIALALGSGIALLGVAWPRPKDDSHMSVTALILEQVGLVTVGVATVFYVSTICMTVGPSASIPAGLITAFGASCLWRAWQIQRVLRQIEPGGCNT